MARRFGNVRKNLWVFALAASLLVPSVALAGRATTSRFVVARSRATMAGAPVGRISAGEHVSIVRKQGAWALVRWGSDQGWIRTSALMGASKEETDPAPKMAHRHAPKSSASERELSDDDGGDQAADEEEDAPSRRNLSKKERLSLDKAKNLGRQKKLAEAKAKALEEAEAKALAEANEIDSAQDAADEDDAPRSKKKAHVKSERVAIGASAENKKVKKGWGGKFSKRNDQPDEVDEDGGDESQVADADDAPNNDDDSPFDKREAKKAKKSKKHVSRDDSFASDDSGDIGDSDDDRGSRSRDDDDDDAPSARVRRRHHIDKASPLMFALGADLGYESIEQRFVSDAPVAGNYLPRYSLTSGAAAVGIAGRVTYPLGPVRVGANLIYRYGFSSGLTVPTPGGSETLQMATQQMEATGTVGMPVYHNKVNLTGLIGYARYGTQIQDGKQALLPSDLIAGVLVGAAADIPHVMFKAGMRLHLDFMPTASISQNKGRREGQTAQTMGAGAGVQFYMPIAMRGRMKAHLGYDYRYSFVDFSGMGERVNSTKAQRSSGTHAVFAGIGWEM